MSNTNKELQISDVKDVEVQVNEEKIEKTDLKRSGNLFGKLLEYFWKEDEKQEAQSALD